MTEMSYEDFKLPSETQGGGGAAHPSMAQLAGRLVHILPVGREDNVTTEFQKIPHTRLTVDLTFFDGKPIDRVLDKDGQVKIMLTPPVSAGQTMTGRFMNQSWFVSRLKDKVGQPGFPGMVGVIGKIQGRTNQMWALTDPTPEQMAQVRQWFAWRQTQPPGSTAYTPAPIAPPVTPSVPAAAPAYGQQSPPSQYQQQAPPAQPTAQPANPFAQYQQTAPPPPAAAPPAPAAQPGPDTPPWLR